MAQITREQKNTLKKFFDIGYARYLDDQTLWCAQAKIAPGKIFPYKDAENINSCFDQYQAYRSGLLQGIRYSLLTFHDLLEKEGTVICRSLVEKLIYDVRTNLHEYLTDNGWKKMYMFTSTETILDALRKPITNDEQDNNYNNSVPQHWLTACNSILIDTKAERKEYIRQMTNSLAEFIRKSSDDNRNASEAILDLAVLACVQHYLEAGRWIDKKNKIHAGDVVSDMDLINFDDSVPQADSSEKRETTESVSVSQALSNFIEAYKRGKLPPKIVGGKI